MELYHSFAISVIRPFTSTVIRPFYPVLAVEYSGNIWTSCHLLELLLLVQVWRDTTLTSTVYSDFSLQVQDNY